MKENNIFKDKLYNHTMPVRDGLWDAIEAQLPPKKEQRIFPVFWFILFASTLLGGALMLGLFNQQASIEPASLPANSTGKTTMSDPSASTTLYGNNNTASDESMASASTATMTNPNQSSSSTALTSETSTSNTTSKAIEPNSKNNSSSNNTTAYPARSKRSKSTPVAASKSSNQSELSNINTPLNQPLLFPADALQTQAIRNDYTTALIPMQDVSLEGTSDLFVIHPAVKPDPNCYKFTSNGGQIVYSIDGFIGPGISPKSYTSNADEGSVYITAREATESNQYAWSAGARFNIHHRSGLTGRIGLSYTQAGDVFDYTDSMATQSTTRIDSFFAADGTFLYAETSQVLILGTLIKKIHNTYRYLDIPLIIGYEMPMGRSNLMFNIGPVLNLKSSHEGQILDPMLHPRPITDGEPGAIDVYKTSLGMSLYIGAGVLFPISDALSGLVEPSFMYRLNPVTVDNYPISEHRHYAGLNIGLRYHIK